ncbi:MAG: hypothetical protein Q8P41_24625 [Pseudomonadota bacterium]|nr:hypothetical protein [Pseudomonadota bacterium]
MILLLLISCMGYSESQVRRGELNCEWLDTCGELGTVGFEGVGDCKAAAAAQPYDDDQCPDYDATAMSGCLRAYEDAIAGEDCAAEFTDACLVCG